MNEKNIEETAKIKKNDIEEPKTNKKIYNKSKKLQNKSHDSYRFEFCCDIMTL